MTVPRGVSGESLRESSPRPWRRPASEPAGGSIWGLVMAPLIVIHGLMHVTGFVVLWDLGRPANLIYAEASPTPGTVAGRLAGVGWLLAGGLLVAGATMLLRRTSLWWAVTLAGACLSIALIIPNQDGASVGFTADVVVALYVMQVLARRRPEKPANT